MIMILVLSIGLILDGNVWGQCIDNIDVDYFQDFEADVIEECWYGEDRDGDGYRWSYINNSSYAHSGTWARISYSYISGTGDVKPDNILWTSLFTVPTDGECYFSWWHRKYSSAWDDYYSVWIAPEDDDYMYRIGDVNRSSTVDYQYDRISLNNYKGQSIRIGFRHWHSDGQWALLIDDVSIEWNNPLPITLLSFMVTANPEGNLLEWVTATEEHNAGFKLQRSTDAIDWTDFAWVTSACSGNSIENTNYSFLDDNPPSDTTYYRFEQMDSTSYSTTYYSDIVVAMREPATNNIIPSVYYDNCICLVGGDKVCDAYVYYPDGRMRYSARLNPYETKRLNIYGFYIIEVLWVEDGDLQRKAFKVFSY